jgi:hypothetical protein
LFDQLQSAADERVVLQAHHQTGLQQRVQHGVALFGVEAADFHRSTHADLIAWRHRQQVFLEPIESLVDGS